MSRAYKRFGVKIALLGVALITFAASEQAHAADEKTAEQAFKNIQVLKGMPESQVIGAMAYMEASLGAKDCEYCHVKTGEYTWEWDKDDKQKKQTARKMVQMVLDINKTSFNGRPEVTCYTCHQGHEHPVAVPSLPLPAAEAELPRPSGRFPTPNELVDKYVQAIGGKETVAKFNALVLKGTQTGEDGSPRQVEVYWKSPGKVASSVSTPGGTFAQGFDGTAGWTQMPNGTREMSPAEVVRMKNIAGAYDPIKLREPYPRMRLMAKEKVDGREAWVLRAQGSDNRFDKLYFDAESGLLVRKVSMTPTMIGTIPDQIDFGDYRETGGIRLPFSIRVVGLNSRGTWEQKFSTVQSDPAIEDSRFAKPAADNKTTEQR